MLFVSCYKYDALTVSLKFLNMVQAYGYDYSAYGYPGYYDPADPYAGYYASAYGQHYDPNAGYTAGRILRLHTDLDILNGHTLHGHLTPSALMFGIKDVKESEQAKRQQRFIE